MGSTVRYPTMDWLIALKNMTSIDTTKKPCLRVGPISETRPCMNLPNVYQIYYNYMGLGKPKSHTLDMLALENS